MVLFPMCTCSCGIFGRFGLISKGSQSQMEKGAKKGTNLSRGLVTSFGFKKTPPPNLPSVPSASDRVQETMQPLHIAPVIGKKGSQTVSRPTKPSENRFGFRSPALSNKVGDVEGAIGVAATRLHMKKPSPRSLSEPRKLEPGSGGLQTRAQLQLPVRAPCAAGYNAEADKRAKTAANTAASRALPTPPVDSRMVPQPKSRKNDSILEIQQLEQSPSMGNKFRPTQLQLQLQHQQNLQQQQRQLQQLGLPPQPEQRLNGRPHISKGKQPPEPEVALPRRAAPPLRRPVTSIDHMAFSSNEETGDEAFLDEAPTEEKQIRDRESNEKEMLGCPESPTEDMWGRGEAMANDEVLCSSLDNMDQSPENLGSVPLRSVLLKLEDPSFACLAALSRSEMLEDLKIPDSPDFSSSSPSPSSVGPLPPPPSSLSAKGTPGTPGTPTQGSHSLSSPDRDFLIDDEIADQPGLVFDSRDRPIERRDPECIAHAISKLAGEMSDALVYVDPKLSSGQSVSTLSPCESLASDDLMLEFEDTIAPSNFDKRNEMDDAVFKSNLHPQNGQATKEWSLLSSHPGVSGVRPVQSRLRVGVSSSSGSVCPGSPRSRSTLSSPLKVHSTHHRIPTIKQGDDGIQTYHLDRHTYDSICRDLVDMQAMLPKLQKVLEESGAVIPGTVTGSHSDSYVDLEGEENREQFDLRRQVVLLRAEMEERDRRILALERSLAMASEGRSTPPGRPLLVNRATQTDRVRPLSTGPMLFQCSTNCSSASFVTLKPSYEVVEPARVSPQVSVTDDSIVKPCYWDGSRPPSPSDDIEIRTPQEIVAMRKAGHLARFILNSVKSFIKVGVTTDEIDKFCHELILKHGAYPSPLNYRGFPKSVCTSVNNVVIHGIPDSRPLKDGDIINVDVTVFKEGVHGDCSNMYCVGSVDPDGRRLCDVASQCLEAAIQVCKPGAPFSIIGQVIEETADEHGFCVFPGVLGHGIGTAFHTQPSIFHFDTVNTSYDCGRRMKPGMTFTIEPALGEGDSGLSVIGDGWTAVTDDGSRAAQWEHTILITDQGSQPLTVTL